ncbi:sirohydrochlorin chelatase [Nonomuraea africana]|uniref:Sirohydrochlorin ferrochelatase n=1 Tax=Nonomuraea africana TaxID=46171 RepID=A0ABR9KFB3_9ACTN|nr:CbiX/SirB N-terminal domain-containing protein [Nonomuraea africana]MBE1560669.1 sirohydrochlorin ferrochelatase [Nonomuraea africana]
MRLDARGTLVIAAHGTRSAAGEETLARLTALVRALRPGRRVELAYLEISRPLLADVLPRLPGPVTVVPLLLAGGYHVHIDLPDVIARSRPDAAVAGPLGPHPLLAHALARRLARAGLRATDAVVLGAAGSSDPAALADVRAAARLLAVRLSRPVTAAFATGGGPTVGEALDRTRCGPAPRVALASYLLAPGFFHDRLSGAGADVVTEPIGADPDLAALVWARHDQAAGSSRNSLTISSALASREGPASAPTNIS